MRGGPPLHRRWLAALADLPPAAFSLVMATGIVSLGADMVGQPRIARLLFALNVLQYALLGLLYGLRALRHPRRCLGDLADHARGPGYFTIVAGTGILASQCLVLQGEARIAWGLHGLALLAWLVLTYAIFAAFTVRRDKPGLAQGLSGVWLLAVVATQSLAVTGALLGAQAPAALRPALDLLSLALWLWGGMLYLMVMALIFYRCMFLRLDPGDLSPPYWITMGAMAISTLAGAQLLLNAPHAPLLQALRPFLMGVTLLYWAAGSWWIPLLLVLGVWRHGLQRLPIRYDPQYWAMVFPLGMYAAATGRMSEALGLDVLHGLPQAAWWIALLAWALTFAGMLRRLVRLS